MRHPVLFRSLVAVPVISWFFWCLYWPYLAIQQDQQAVLREANETRKVCLQQPTLTSSECAVDFRIYQGRLLQAVAPSGKSAYQLFAGESAGAATGFMAALIGVPIIAFYLATRLGLGAFRWLARVIR